MNFNNKFNHKSHFFRSHIFIDHKFLIWYPNNWSQLLFIPSHPTPTTPAPKCCCHHGTTTIQIWTLQPPMHHNIPLTIITRICAPHPIITTLIVVFNNRCNKGDRSEYEGKVWWRRVAESNSLRMRWGLKTPLLWLWGA